MHENIDREDCHVAKEKTWSIYALMILLLLGLGGIGGGIVLVLLVFLPSIKAH